MGHLEHYSHSASSAETRPPVWQQPAQGARGRGGAEKGKAPSHSHACALGQSLFLVLLRLGLGNLRATASTSRLGPRHPVSPQQAAMSSLSFRATQGVTNKENLSKD